MRRILFVCTGNTCRSPLAEHLLRHKAGDRMEVKSAGVAAFNGYPASTHVKSLLQEMGISENHSSQMVTPELINWADLILTMTTGHKDLLLQHFPEKGEYIYTLKEYVHPEAGQYDIMDPFGGSLEAYQSTLNEINDYLEQLLQKEDKSS